MATTYEIVQGLAQAAANSFDGALNEEGEQLAAGLQREEGDPILDKRVMDGFNVKFSGNVMCLSYQSEVQLKEVYTAGFESEIEQRLQDIAGFLKKEYKKITGSSVSLTKQGEASMRAENTSRIRSWVTAKQDYLIGGVEESVALDSESEPQVEKSWESFLGQGGWGDKTPNDERPKDSEAKS